MIPKGTKYVIVGVHERDATAHRREKLYGAVVEAIDLGRWPQKRNCPSGYYHGWVKFVTGVKDAFEVGDEFKFYAVYLRRVKEKV